MWKSRVVETGEAFLALRDEWTELLRHSRADHLFTSWEWLYTWWQHLASGAMPFVITVRSEGRLMGLAPLAIEPACLSRMQLTRRLTVLGRGDVGSDYVDVIARRGFETEVAAAVAGVLAARGLVVEFVRQTTDATSTLVTQALQAQGWVSLPAPADISPLITMAGRTWADYLASLGADHRYNFRRRLRNLEKLGPVTFEAVTSETDRRAALDQLVRQHNERWAGRGGSTAFHTAALVAFHHAISSLALAQGWLRLFVLRVNGTPAAVWYCFARHGRYAFYQSAFDPQFARHSVGLVTMGLAIAAAFEEQAIEFDFLHGDESYKFLWTRERRALQTLEFFPPRFAARVHRAAVGLRRRAGRRARALAAASADFTPAFRRIPRERSAAVVPSTR